MSGLKAAAVRTGTAARGSWAGRIASLAFFAVLIWLAFGYIVAPLARTVVLAASGDQGAAAFAGFFAKSQNADAVAHTIAVGALSTLVCGVVGITLAVYLRFFCQKHRRAVHILLMSPVMIPGVIIVIAFLQLYGDTGLLTKLFKLVFNTAHAPWSFSGLGGIVFVIGFTQYVYFFLNVYTALQNIDANVVDSVRSMGGGFWSVVRCAVLPVVKQAVIVSAMSTFVSASGSYSAAALVGGQYRVLSTQVVMAKANNDMVLASIEVTVLLVIGVAATVIGLIASRKARLNAAPRARYWRPDVSRRSVARVVLRLFALVQIILVLLPVAAIVYLSFVTTRSIMLDAFPADFTTANYAQLFASRRSVAPLSNSLAMAAIAVVASCALALPCAYANRTKHPHLLARLSVALLMLPWCMPGSAVAIDLINAFKHPSVFAFGQTLIGTFEILPIAYTIIALPIMMNTCRVATEGIQDNAEDASRSLGAGGARTFLHVALPAMAPGVLSASILVFVRTMGEYTMSALLYGVRNRPISVSVVTAMQEYQVGMSLACGTLVIAVCTVLLFALLKLGGDKQLR